MITETWLFQLCYGIVGRPTLHPTKNSCNLLNYRCIDYKQFCLSNCRDSVEKFACLHIEMSIASLTWQESHCRDARSSRLNSIMPWYCLPGRFAMPSYSGGVTSFGTPRLLSLCSVLPSRQRNTWNVISNS